MQAQEAHPLGDAEGFAFRIIAPFFSKTLKKRCSNELKSMMLVHMHVDFSIVYVSEQVPRAISKHVYHVLPEEVISVFYEKKHQGAVWVLDANADFYQADTQTLLMHTGLLSQRDETVAVRLDEADERSHWLQPLLQNKFILTKEHAHIGTDWEEVLQALKDLHQPSIEYVSLFPVPLEPSAGPDVLGSEVDFGIAKYSHSSPLFFLFSNGKSTVQRRPLSPEDDGTLVSDIEIATDGKSAVIHLTSGKALILEVAALKEKRRPVLNVVQDELKDLAFIGSRIKKLRMEYGITQSELSKRTGIHRPNIARLESGKHAPSLDTLGKIAAAIGVPPQLLWQEHP